MKAILYRRKKVEKHSHVKGMTLLSSIFYFFIFTSLCLLQVGYGHLTVIICHNWPHAEDGIAVEMICLVKIESRLVPMML